MNREIKARIWDEDNKGFSYVDLLNIENTREVYDSFGEYFSMGYLRQSPKYFQLYTGLKDKNGKEIYDGDVCKSYYKGEWVNLTVCWNPLGMWSVKWKDGYLNNYHINNQNIEIIGNIYESK